jgi:hypothetical protein
VGAHPFVALEFRGERSVSIELPALLHDLDSKAADRRDPRDVPREIVYAEIGFWKIRDAHDAGEGARADPCA